jgi:site-specific recombinase XerD
VPTEAIADLLGHSSIAITAVYAKVVDMNKYTPSYIELHLLQHARRFEHINNGRKYVRVTLIC